MLRKRTSTYVVFVLAGLLLAALACGPVEQVNQAVEEAQDVAEQAEQIATSVSDTGGEGSDADPAEGGEPSVFNVEVIDACALLTEEEVAAAIGEPVNQVVNGPGVCIYNQEVGRQAHVNVQVQDSPESALLIWDVFLSSASEDGPPETLDGPWDAGFYDDSGVGNVYALVGNAVVAISSGNRAHYDGTREAEISLMELVVTRLP